ncbi:MAG TPA: OsmC family peroxiredoxin, partial [Salinisphaeraceae bacterium]|nr:OsmC family peroxiredoxin [Salinisphaeraceae bacterium]
TSPEELLAAAHASCYSMALSLMLGEKDVTPERIDTTATVTVSPDGGGFTITTVHLDVHAKISGVDAKVFEEAANMAKEGCPVSKLFQGAEITLETHLNA